MPQPVATPAAPPLAATAERVPPPPIPACREWAAAYDGAQGPLLDLTQAVPGYAPHPELLARLGAAAADPSFAGYGPLEGESGLREAFAEETRLLHGGDVAADDVRITAGANQGFNLAMTAITAPGDAVILPTPWFFNHQMALTLRGVEGIPLPCRAEDGFLPDPDCAAALITPHTRAIVLV
ncbi:MAG TPA: aminotransferase class I/II-fold pyridoxal phosphate-dependent enzyme, partial [Acetobacteraceae bacterium]|nr:aminotransferase class I/II-fold pyridoxal phosphate-dependent enzyme [Acetobacteraceae bacterium]